MADVTQSTLHQMDTGILHAKDACIVLIKTEWNAGITDELERGCRRELAARQVGQVTTLVVPGAFEIPYAIKAYYDQAARLGRRVDAFVALGCVIRGGTPHFEYVCRAVTDGVVQLNLQLPVPTIFGVLTVDNLEQARDRIGGRHGHKGEEAALTALKMISFKQSIA
ncbi:MAG TPA: 6,7-dimethyl-8-ribityllumazine synthase [Chitinophagaceae bacterium]|nr:6,7-dimethyl-8-ribityllumazine synthase [Chitinophagaceae bacterium]